MTTTQTPAGITPMRSVRVSDETWDAAKALAEREGTTVSDVLRRALDRELEQAEPAA